MVSPASASGLIPAHAGKTSGRRQTIRRRRAHPRSRGENCERCVQPPQGSGSSPLTRGKHARSLDDHAMTRLIPAHAGKTACDATSTTTARAHPRSRGENCERCVQPPQGSGSSPLTRGKLQGSASRHAGGRLIPAHAGKTCGRTGARTHARAHPRSRGENDPVARLKLCAQGSSPLTRGKRGRVCGAWMPRGLIPAHAGKTVTL